MNTKNFGGKRDVQVHSLFGSSEMDKEESSRSPFTDYVVEQLKEHPHLSITHLSMNLCSKFPESFPNVATAGQLLDAIKENGVIDYDYSGVSSRAILLQDC